MKNRQILSLNLLFLLFTSLANSTWADEQPDVDYRMVHPYSSAGAPVVEVLSDKIDGKVVYRYFYAGDELPLQKVVDRVKRITILIKRGDSGSKVIVLHEEKIESKQLSAFEKLIVADGIKVHFYKKKGLRGDLLKYIEWKRKHTPKTIVKMNNVPKIKVDFARISLSILSLKKPLEEAPKEVIDNLVENCRSFLKKHEKSKTHLNYRLGEDRLQRLLRIQKSLALKKAKDVKRQLEINVDDN